MGHRANYVIIRHGQATAFYDQWGAMGCIYQFAVGPEKAAGAVLVLKQTPELMDWAFAEGGYLIDFDHQKAIVFGCPSEVDLQDLGDLGEFGEVAAASLAEASKLNEALSRSPGEFLVAISPQWVGWTLEWNDLGVDAFASHLEGRSIRTIRTRLPSAPAEREIFSHQA